MHVKSINQQRGAHVDFSTQSQDAEPKRLRDTYEPPFHLPPKTAEQLLASAEKTLRQIKHLVDTTFQVSESEHVIDLAVVVRDLRTELRNLQVRHGQGEDISRYEMFEWRRLLWEVELEISQTRAEVVAAHIADDVDFDFFDLLDLVETPAFADKILARLGRERIETLKTLGVVEKLPHTNSFRATANGAKTLKDAMLVLKDCDSA